MEHPIATFTGKYFKVETHRIEKVSRGLKFIAIKKAIQN